MSRLFAIVVYIIIAGIWTADAQPAPVLTGDFAMDSYQDIALDRQVSLHQVTELYGRPVRYTIEFGEFWTGWHAVLSNVELWVAGPTDTESFGTVERVIISQPGFKSARGIQIGDPESRMMLLYGKPGFTSTAADLTWHRYFIPNGLRRIIFGINSQGTVSRIGYSLTTGGL